MAKIRCIITYFISLLAGLFKHLLTAIGLKDPIPILCGDKIILQLQKTLTMFNGLTQKPSRSWCSFAILEVLVAAKPAMKAGVVVVATRPNRNSDGRWAPWCLMRGEWAWANRASLFMFTSLGELDQGRDRKRQRSLKPLSDSSDSSRKPGARLENRFHLL